ncbi:hypothetical protein KFL_001700150 [Klebsormidium nitens]|uniref:Uncharacterized protein n=1 Tax=Klebsormidium nitens TaxID=105231 RepID=A0A1Y1HZ65_KLENI|nr:hypothetical protein KFL_001700150 [Klebsormidium nitens]|eukprot:GAQ83960.1 hypothetical protein KFL_001700150 [Klebsormidium nitens]
MQLLRCTVFAVLLGRPAIFLEMINMEPSLVREIASLHRNAHTRSLAQSYGLAIQTVSWEDTARTKHSCWGPNIADVTLHAAGHSLPMLRKPNFADVTADVSIGAFSVTAGNETPSSDLRRVGFRDYVANTLGLPGLVLDRDDVLLTSAQACVLPCGPAGETEFCPQIYSYQSRPADPAVLVVVASSQGTSAHVITGRSEKLLFNRGGRGAMFLAKRLSQDRRERGAPETGPMTDDEADRNALLLFQIPLKQRPVPAESGRSGPVSVPAAAAVVLPRIRHTPAIPGAPPTSPEACAPAAAGRGAPRTAGLEYATLRASERTLAAFKGLAGFKLERDEWFPIRVTFQMYTVTDDPALTEAQVRELAERTGKVYARGKESGSLVITATARATEPRPLSNVAGAEDMPIFRFGV